jgi:hypothetical protein
MSYEQADGWNNEGALAPISIQPRCAGIKKAEKRFSVSSVARSSGAQYADLIYTALLADQFDALLAEFGLDSAESSRRTFTLPIDDRTFGVFNGTIIRPEPDYQYWYRDVVFRIADVKEVES